MENAMERIRRLIANSTWCYAREDKEGFVQKEECPCGENKCCQEAKDAKRFRERTKDFDIEYGDFDARRYMISELKKEFKDSNWWKTNIKE